MRPNPRRCRKFLLTYLDFKQVIDVPLVVKHQRAQGGKRIPRIFVDVLQGVIVRNGQAKLIQKLPITVIDTGNDLIQGPEIHNLIGHAGRIFRFKGGIVDTPTVDITTL